MDKEIIIDGTFDVSKGNQKYAKKYSPVEDWYKAKNNMLEGISVAECVHFTRQYNYGYCELSNDSCNEFQCNCAKNKNCYYKQLKRLEQENAELKAENEQLKTKVFKLESKQTSMGEQNKELIEDNLNLSKDNERKQEMIDRQWKLLEQCGVSAGGELKRVSHLLENLRKENERLKLSERDLSRICQGFKKDIETEKSYTLKYHTTLQDIKEIVEPIYEDYSKRWDDNVTEGLEQILQKISDCEV